MRLRIREHLKSEKGNALLMALSVIMVLTAFGTASLMTSVANIQMSAKYRNWSQDYYALDMNAEDKVNQLNTLLQHAEKDAQDYMAGHYYIYSDTDLVHTSSPPENLKVASDAQDYINSEWLTDVAPNMQDLNHLKYKASLEKFQIETFQRLYYYYASRRLEPGGYKVTYLKSTSKSLGNYQVALFSGGTQGTQVLEEGNLRVDIGSAEAITPNADIISRDQIHEISAIAPHTVNRKTVTAKLNVKFPEYTVQEQTRQIPIQGNPVWANAITAAGNIGFVGPGTSTVNGDIFAADSSETLPLDDNVVTNNGIYCQGAVAKIYGNAYSKGNVQIIGSNSALYVHAYPSIDVTLKKNIFSANNLNYFLSDTLNNNLFFDLAAARSIPGIDVTDYLEDLVHPQTSIPMVYHDATGGNVYCNSLAVQGSYPKPATSATQNVSNANINVDGNVTTYNDILMEGLNSNIIVAKNNIGINSSSLTTNNPNASSSVINNTPLKSDGLKESTITLNGKFIVPGTSYAKYTGIKKAGESFFNWTNNSYYQTGESISARNSDIYSAYMAPVSNPLPGYDYYYDQFTSDPKPTTTDESGHPDESEISSYYFMRADTQVSPPFVDALAPKIQQLVDFVNGKILNGQSVSSNVFSSSSVNGYSQGAALLQKPSASSVTVYSYNQLDQNYLNYHKFQLCLADIFKAKTQQLGTVKPLGTGGGFEGVFVNKGALVKNDGTFKEGVNSSPTTTVDSFVYSKLALTDLDLDLGDKSGIIYCEGNLDIKGNGNFKGAIICEGNVTVSGNPTITYDENSIKKTLESYSGIRNFFAPGNMGVVTYSPYTAPSYDGAVRSNVVRYKILEWKEIQQ